MGGMGLDTNGGMGAMGAGVGGGMAGGMGGGMGLNGGIAMAGMPACGPLGAMNGAVMGAAMSGMGGLGGAIGPQGMAGEIPFVSPNHSQVRRLLCMASARINCALRTQAHAHTAFVVADTERGCSATEGVGAASVGPLLCHW